MVFREPDRYDRVDLRPWPVDPSAEPLNPSAPNRKGPPYAPTWREKYPNRLTRVAIGAVIAIGLVLSVFAAYEVVLIVLDQLGAI